MSSQTFDDRDPAIHYTGRWFTAGSQKEYKGTTTGTDDLGSTALVTFTGTGIDVFGTVGLSEGLRESTYTIDSNQSSTQRYLGVRADDVQYGVRFCNFHDLQLGPHTLFIANGEHSNATLFIDYFIVSTSASSNRDVQSASPPLGPIIGGALGGLALICLVVVGIVFYRGRRRRRGHAETGPGRESVPLVNPFAVPSPYPQNTSQIPHDFSSTSNSGSFTFAPTFRSGKQPLLSQSGPSTLPMSSTSSDVTPLQAHHSTTTIDPPPRYSVGQ